MVQKFILILTLLIGCNLSAKTNSSQKKLFELDLTSQNISSEGGGIELEKKQDYCLIVLSLYGESGQEKYKFKFKKNNLITTDYLKYRYKNGRIEINDDVKDLIATDHSEVGNNDMELITNKSFTGSKNTNIVKKFNLCKKKIPQKILIKNCG